MLLAQWNLEKSRIQSSPPSPLMSRTRGKPGSSRSLPPCSAQYRSAVAISLCTTGGSSAARAGADKAAASPTAAITVLLRRPTVLRLDGAHCGRVDLPLRVAVVDSAAKQGLLQPFGLAEIRPPDIGPSQVDVRDVAEDLRVAQVGAAQAHRALVAIRPDTGIFERALDALADLRELVVLVRILVVRLLKQRHRAGQVQRHPGQVRVPELRVVEVGPEQV